MASPLLRRGTGSALGRRSNIMIKREKLISLKHATILEQNALHASQISSSFSSFDVDLDSAEFDEINIGEGERIEYENYQYEVHENFIPYVHMSRSRSVGYSRNKML